VSKSKRPLRAWEEALLRKRNGEPLLPGMGVARATKALVPKPDCAACGNRPEAGLECGACGRKLLDRRTYYYESAP
jgi:hypothetical protein